MIDKEKRLIVDENLIEHTDIIDDGFTVRDSNLCQPKPHTSICGKKKGLVFESDNLMNCDLPEDTKIGDDCQVLHQEITPEREPTDEEITDKKLKSIADSMVEMAATYPDKVKTAVEDLLAKVTPAKDPTKGTSMKVGK